MMVKFLCAAALICGLAATASADWRTSTNRSCRSSTDTYFFPQSNRVVIGYDNGYGSRSFYSGPMVQYGSSSINYQYSSYGNVDPYASGITVRANYGLRTPW